MKDHNQPISNEEKGEKMTNKKLHTPFNVNIVVNSGGTAFNVTQAGVAVSPNLSVSGLAAGNCNFTYTQIPTISNPSFTGAILSSVSNGSLHHCRSYLYSYINPYPDTHPR